MLLDRPNFPVCKDELYVIIIIIIIVMNIRYVNTVVTAVMVQADRHNTRDKNTHVKTSRYGFGWDGGGEHTRRRTG